MLVNVISMLVVQVPIVDVVDVSIVLDGFMAVALLMFAVMTFVNESFRVLLTIMNVIDVAVVIDGFVAVAWQMLVIGSWVAIRH